MIKKNYPNARNGNSKNGNFSFQRIYGKEVLMIYP